MGHTLPLMHFMGARKIDSFKNVAGISVSNFRESTICMQMANIIQLFKVTTLQLKKHQPYVKPDHGRQFFIKNQMGKW